jgi:hypothetical protein
MKNTEHCKRIAEDLEAYAEGRVYRCPNCGEHVTDDTLFCDCGEQVDLTDGGWEQCDLLYYLEDALDIEYRIGSRREYRSCKIMIAFGGPNIYIDTASKLVTLHWYGDYAEYPIDPDVCRAIDACAEDCFST